MENKQKILLCGDVEGKFNALFKRVEIINQKSGPFDLLICVGNFFGINNKEFTPYKIGEKKVPLPTYILGPNRADLKPFYPENEEFEICHNVYYLGKRGVYTDSKGLKIAYLSGTSKGEEAVRCTPKDVSDLYDVCIRGNPTFRGVDLLLTSEWPNGIIEDIDSKKITLSVNSQSDYPSYLCLKLKPRYLISGLEGVFYERRPFRCPSLGDHDTTLESVTRFIGLARVGNPNKDKWIYALSLVPIDKMKISDLMQKTIDETPCPFNLNELDSKIFGTKRKSTGAEQYFFDMTSPAEENRGQRKKRQKIEFDQSKCWFCLASPSVEKHLIVTVANSSYLALAKGGIVEEHFLICPIEHYQNSLGQPREVQDEINQFKQALIKFYGRKGEVPIFFERNYKTSHMQLQVVPIPKKATKELKEIFQDEAEAHGFKLEELDSSSRLDQVLPPKTPFFIVELPDQTILYTKIQGAANFPLNFGREVLASGPILDVPNRIDWKECLVPKSEEEEIVQRIRTDFEPFDFNLD